MSNPFETGMGGAEETGGQNYIKEGVHHLRVVAVKYRPVEKSFKGANNYIINFEVLASDGAHKPQELIDDVIKDKNKDGTPNTKFLGNVKSFIKAALPDFDWKSLEYAKDDKPEQKAAKDKQWFEFVEASYNPEKQILVNQEVKCVAAKINLERDPTKAERPFTQKTYKPWVPATSEEVAQSAA